MKRHFYIITLIGVVMLSMCTPTNKEVILDIEAEPFEALSNYQFFTGDIKDLNPNDGVLPYDLNTPLFSDYAFKARFVWMPKGTSADYKASGSFAFPIGTVLIKNFYYPVDFAKPEAERRILETRLLIKRVDDWDALPYVWNDEQTEAFLELAGGEKQVSWKHYDGEERSIKYFIPNKVECKGCHNVSGKMEPIGPTAANLNRDYPYFDGTSNQIDKWSVLGYLSGLSADEPPKLSVWDDETTGTVEQRAKAYLDVNCGHCHSEEGPASTSGLFLKVGEDNLANWGVCKSPVAAGKGSGNLLYDIYPGKPDSSIMVYRMESTDLGVMMPEMGRKQVHEEGVELIRQWISEMKGDCD